jgi:hypothetical protein
MKTEIEGMAMAGEEARELARSCGAEAEAFLRKSLPGIPHADYRLLVMREALKAGRSPTTKDYAKAQANVDDALAARGIGIVIPAARPGRVTR